MVLQVAYKLLSAILPSQYYLHAFTALFGLIVIYAFAQGRTTTRRGAHIITLSSYPITHTLPSLLIPLLRTTTKNESIYAEQADMSDLESVRSFCTRFLTGQDQRLDAIVFAHEYTSKGRLFGFGKQSDRISAEKEREAESLASFLMLTLLLPALLVAPSSATYASSALSIPSMLQPSRLSPHRFLSRRRHRLPCSCLRATVPCEQRLVFGGAKATHPSSSVKYPGGIRLSGHQPPGHGLPLLGAERNSESGSSLFGFILYTLLFPILFLTTKSSKAAIDVRRCIWRIHSSGRPGRDANALPEEVLKPGALYLGRAVWEWYEERLKVWEASAEKKVNADGKTSKADATPKAEDGALQEEGEVHPQESESNSLAREGMQILLRTIHDDGRLPGTPCVASAQQAEWDQCGGIGWTGATTCIAGTTCQILNDYYSQCLPGAASSSSSSPTSSAPGSTPTAVSNANYWFSFGDSYTQTGFVTNDTLPALGNPLGNPPYPGYTAVGGTNWIDVDTVVYNKSLVLTYNYAYGGATINASLVQPYYLSGDRDAFSDTLLDSYFGLVQSVMIAQGASAQAAEKTVIDDFNSKLATRVSSLQSQNSGVQTWLWDSNAAFTTVLNNPTAYGFIDNTSYGGTGDFWGISPAPPPPYGLFPFLQGRDSHGCVRLVEFAHRGRGAGGSFYDFTARYGAMHEEDRRTLRETFFPNLARPAHPLAIPWLHSKDPDVSPENAEEKRQTQELFEMLTDRLGLTEVLDLPMVALSNGQTRRARIIKALLAKPKLLLLDEPLNPLPEWTTHVALIKDDGTVHAGKRDDMPRPQAQSLPFTVASTSSSEPTVGLDTSEKKFCRRITGIPLVHMTGVSVKYGERMVLDSVRWTIVENSRWHLQGANGSGKTTLLALLTGDHPQSYAESARLLLFSRSRDKWATPMLHRRIGRVSPELHNAFPRRHSMSVWDAVGTGFDGGFVPKGKMRLGLDREGRDLERGGRDEEWRVYRMRTVLKHLGPSVWRGELGGNDEEFWRRPFVDLTPGEQSMVLLMRALVSLPLWYCSMRCGRGWTAGW
ncbi:hypothetical protein A0H81_10141 [Grifola frondosa]|uniref:CBM1 domain-containing protein n=1 Tax=Grifola frondosa TaxID=5627 RepID=A0A1C7LXW4_GRIFR|nr:hypothetical protein A0H81_10141 [Grifola frondosa]